MTNLRGVGGAPRGLRTHQPSLHGRRTNEFRRAIKTAPTRRASLQRSIARKGSANATIIPPTNARQATTNEITTHPQPNHRQLNPSRRDENILPTSNSKPTNLNGDDQGDHAIARTGTVTREQVITGPAHVTKPDIQAKGKRHGRAATKGRMNIRCSGTTEMQRGQRVPTARFQRVKITGRRGERAEVWFFLEVST